MGVREKLESRLIELNEERDQIMFILESLNPSMERFLNRLMNLHEHKRIVKKKKSTTQDILDKFNQSPPSIEEQNSE